MPSRNVRVRRPTKKLAYKDQYYVQRRRQPEREASKDPGG